MPTLRYEICDVFTDRPLTGNALAVFTNAHDLDEATMQALAREMNLSESAFVVRPTTAEADAGIRIFTPTMELPFAGHPTLGSAFVLGAASASDLVRLETRRGVVPVRLKRGHDRTLFGSMSQPLPRLQPFAATADLLRALGADGSGLPVELYDNGPQYVFVELASPEAVAALRPDMGRLAALGSIAVSVFARSGTRWKVRVFAPGEGIPEDPATGAAAGPMALHLARHGRIAFGETVFIDQGVEMRRPSTLQACAFGSADRVERIDVGGSGVVVAKGVFDLGQGYVDEPPHELRT
jgi:trans-2,3-dihydro-3-hydroxyanthranilate isomerase